MTIPTLPQNDPYIEDRQKQLLQATRDYVYGVDLIPGLHLHQIGVLPHKEKFTLKYQAGFVKTFKKLVKHQLRAAEFFVSKINRKDRSVSGDVKALVRVIKDMRERGTDEFVQDLVADLLNEEVIRAKHFSVYSELYRKLPIPNYVERNICGEDSIFAYQRIAGFNPTFLRQIDKIPGNFPVTEEIFQITAAKEVSLEEALRHGRIYLCDYAILDGLDKNAPLGKIKDLQQYLAAPLALFYWKTTGPKPGLAPVAIQLSQINSAEHPIFTPKDGWKWTTAKAFVQTAEANHHETLAHLGYCHLAIEPILMATMRCLAHNHPIQTLLRAHYRFTLAINDAAFGGKAGGGLLGKGRVVDTLLAPTIDQSFELVKRGFETWRFDDVGPVATFKNRGIAEMEDLPDFPFRDDTMLLWNAIKKFVRNYLCVYYGNNGDIANDKELQNWYQQLTSNPETSIKGMDGDPNTLSYLIQVVSQIIYIAGPQHASVNFAQYPFMSYMPNCALALYGPPPTATSEETEETYLDRLPPIDTSLYQMSIAYLLSSRKPVGKDASIFARIYQAAVAFATNADESSKNYCLGDYATGTFEDPRVQGIVKQFQQDLRQAEAEIKERNKTRPYSYALQLPSAVPNSINI